MFLVCVLYVLPACRVSCRILIITGANKYILAIARISWSPPVKCCHILCIYACPEQVLSFIIVDVGAHELAYIHKHKYTNTCIYYAY